MKGTSVIIRRAGGVCVIGRQELGNAVEEEGVEF